MNRLIPASVLAGTLQTVPVAGASPAPHSHDSTAPAAAAVLRQDMRALWPDHVTWTREDIVAALADRPDQQAAASRLAVPGQVLRPAGSGNRTARRSPGVTDTKGRSDRS